MTDKLLIDRAVVEQALKLHEAQIVNENYDHDGCFQHWDDHITLETLVETYRAALAEQPAEQEPVTVLPDGSAFAVMSFPLPEDHWLYAERQYNDGEYEPVELGKPILTHALRDAVVSAVRYAIRGATNCGKEADFDPDALVQNAVYALCGPFTQAYTAPQPTKPRKPLTADEIDVIIVDVLGLDADEDAMQDFARAIEAAHGIGEKP